MYELDHKELIEAEQLAKEGKYEAAHQLINNFVEKEDHTLREILLGRLAKCRLLILQGSPGEAIEIAEQTYKASLELEDKTIIIDSLVGMALALINRNRLDKVEEIIKQAENLLKSAIGQTEIIRKKREADVYYLKAMNSDPNINPLGDVNLALKLYKLSLGLINRNRLDKVEEIIKQAENLLKSA
ncbi:MAG: hypothetical protein ACW96S_11900, partial [Promethearchaeota archaeon]